MARMDVFGDFDISSMIDVNTDEFCEETLKDVAPILEENMKRTARANVMHDGESEMVNSIKAIRPVKSKNGAWIVNVGPRGYSSHIYYSKGNRPKKYNVSNALKAIWKEYGIPSRGIPARPFVSTSASQSESKILNEMQKKFEEHIK